MKLYSTKDKTHIVELKEAVLRGLPPDNGLYMPEHIPSLPKSFFDNLPDLSFQEIAFTVCKNLFQGYIPESDLREIIEKAVNFPAPLVRLDEQIHILELFHGPSLAFKDFGARFMAQLMSYFNQGEKKELVILVATSGDTGGAVAAGFYKTPGIKVVILYPSGKVSNLQEKQLTTLGQNIAALEVEGTFDDCQALVKKAFLDEELTQNIRLTSANSINISRLVPQSFYYFEAYKQAPKDRPINFCIPSGNFGNLTAGLLASAMGLPVNHFIAATNINDVVPEYLESGIFKARPSLRTISNAMDVGNPSNFVRMLDFFKATNERSTWNNMRQSISGYAYTDQETEQAIKEVFERYQYVMDPHGAVGYLAIQEYLQEQPNTTNILLETAHPTKFIDDVERVIGQKIKLPEQLDKIKHKQKESVMMPTDFADFKTWLLQSY
jgi:threonine synthase